MCAAEGRRNAVGTHGLSASPFARLDQAGISCSIGTFNINEDARRELLRKLAREPKGPWQKLATALSKAEG